MVRTCICMFMSLLTSEVHAKWKSVVVKDIQLIMCKLLYDYWSICVSRIWKLNAFYLLCIVNDKKRLCFALYACCFMMILSCTVYMFVVRVLLCFMCSSLEHTCIMVFHFTSICPFTAFSSSFLSLSTKVEQWAKKDNFQIQIVEANLLKWLYASEPVPWYWTSTTW